MKRYAMLLVLALSGLAATPALAQMDHMKMDHMNMGKADKGASTPSTKAFEAANMKMHKDMGIRYSGNTDVDFVRGMIPHHQGAIDMAKIELRYGKDTQIRKLAEEIIKAQESEIAMMKDWLAKNGK